MPDSVTSSSQIDECNTSFLFCFEQVLDALREYNDLFYGRKLAEPKICLFPRKQIDNGRFDVAR